MPRTTEELQKDADKARDYILFSIDHLYTYENYVKTKLAGDFACEIAITLKDRDDQIAELSTKLRESEERMELAQSMIAVGVHGEAVAMLDKDFKDYEYLEVRMKAKRDMEATPPKKEQDDGM